MENVTDLSLILRDYWGIVMMALFLAIIGFVMRPGSAKTYSHAANIPLADDEPAVPAAPQTKGR